MKRLFVILAALTLSLATQAQDKDKYKGLKKISPDRDRGSVSILHFSDDDISIDLDDLAFTDLHIDLSGLESLHELSALGNLENLERLEELEALEVLTDEGFLEDIIEISLDAGLMSLEALKELEVRPRKAQQ